MVEEIRVFSYLYENRRLKLVIEKNQECSANPASSSVLVMVIKKALFCSYKRNGTALSKLELDCWKSSETSCIRIDYKSRTKKKIQETSANLPSFLCFGHSNQDTSVL